MVRKAWAGKVPAFVGMALPVNKKRKSRERLCVCVCERERSGEAVSAMPVGYAIAAAVTISKLTRPYTVAGGYSGSQVRA